MMKKVISFLMILALLSVSAAFADDSNSMKEDGFSTSYSYNYDYWGDVQMSPDPYRVEAVIDSATLGLENLENTRIAKPEGIFVCNSDIYVADTGNNRILQIPPTGDMNFDSIAVVSPLLYDHALHRQPYWLLLTSHTNGSLLAEMSQHTGIVSYRDGERLTSGYTLLRKRYLRTSAIGLHA